MLLALFDLATSWLKLFQVEHPSPIMTPAPGERLLRFVGDKILFTLRRRTTCPRQKLVRAVLRTNLGRAAARRREIIAAHAVGAMRRRRILARRADAKNRRRLANRTAARRSGFFQGQSLSARRKKLAALARRSGRGHFRPSKFRPHRQHHLLRFHATFRRNQKSRLDCR